MYWLKNIALSRGARRRWSAVLTALFLLASLGAARAQPPEPPGQPLLSAKQIAWLRAHPTLRIGVPRDRKPLAFKGQDGAINGSEAAYATLLARKLNIQVQLVTGSPANLERELRSGSIDAMSMQSKQTLDERHYAFTQPYMSLNYAIFSDVNDAAVSDLRSLEGKRIALLDGDHYQYDLLENVENISPVPVRSVEDAVSALMSGRADAYLGPVPVVASYLQSHVITEVVAVKALEDRPLALSYAVRTPDKMLLGVLNSAIEAITPAEDHLVQQTWLNQPLPVRSKQDQPLLTGDERNWLKSHPDLRLAVRKNWPPFEFSENGKPKGLVLDLVKKLEERLDYQFKIVQVSDWSDALDKLHNGDIDVMPALPRTPRRQDRFLFTRTYLSLPIALVIRDDSHFVGDLRELKNQRVGVVRDYATHEDLLINHPNLNIYPVNSVEQGLLQLSNGDLDVMVTQIPSVSYTVAKLGLSNLRITSITPYQYDLRLAVRPDMPELQQILNKALNSMNKKEYDSIYNRWIHLDVQREIDYTVVRRVVLVALVIVGIFLYWNRKLSREVDERIRSEEALRLSEERLRHAMLEAENLARQAESANRAKSEFLANMSHEIRTPMNAVMGYAELLENSITEPRQRGYLESIKTGSRSLLMLINDILDLSRIEAGKMRLEPAPMDLRRLLEEVRQIFAMRADARNLHLNVDVRGELPAAMVLDETRLRQVLFNLVGNAIKFTHEGGVTVTAWVERDDNSVDDRFTLVITVTDTGIGIPYDQQRRIFEAFEQQEGQSSRQYGGTGLGLAISRKLAQMMGGELSVDSEPGEGSTFTVRLRGVETALTRADSVGDTGDRDFRFRPATVLVVDDNETNRKLVRDMLNPIGLEVIEAANGSEALAVARDKSPDLVLMDIRMPVMDGYGARRAMNRDAALSGIPVVALTASVMPGDSARIRETHFDGFLRKPVSRQNMLEMLARFLKQESGTPVAPEKPAKASSGSHPVSPQARRAVRAELETTYFERWEAVKDSGDPERIREFAEALALLGRENGIEELTGYGQQLLDGIDAFDLDRVNNLLQEFPALLEIA